MVSPVVGKTSAEPAGMLRNATVRSFDELETLRPEWDAFIEGVGSDIYFTCDWLRVWWKHYGNGRRLVFVIIKGEDRIVAALPFYVDRVRAGPLSISVARFIGSHSTVPVFTPPIEAGYERDTVRVLCSELLETEQCDCVSLSPLSSVSRLNEGTLELCSDAPNVTVARSAPLGPHTFFQLPDTLEGYLASLTKKTRSNYRRDLKHLSAMGELRSEMASPEDAERVFVSFVALHDAQWSNQGMAGHFGDWPESEAFNLDLVKAFAPKGKLRICALYLDQRPISIQYGFVWGNVCYWRLPARDTRPAFEALGLGRIGLVKLIEAMLAEGVRSIEAGPGHYDYKLRHGAEERPLRQLVFSQGSAMARLKTYMLLAWSDLLNLAYYRIYFQRLRPRLGLPRRPLWRAWIRTRL